MPCDDSGKRVWPRQLVRYAAVGVGVFCVDYSIFLLLSEVCGLDPLWTNPISRSTGGAASFLGHRFITFRRRSAERIVPHAVRFLLVFCLSLGLSQVFLWLFHCVAGIPAPVAKPMGEGLTFLVNFLLIGGWVLA